MLSPIDSSRTGVAIDLLVKGFPHRQRSHWEEAFQRMKAFGGNERAGVPVGQLLEVSGKAVGVLLTPATERLHHPSGPRRAINLASMYIEPEHSWRAPMMFRAVTRQPDAFFTDLSATPNVQRMLVALGFQQVSRGVALNLTPVAALSGGGRVLDLERVTGQAIDPNLRGFLLRHTGFGCVAAAVQEGDSWIPLLFKLRRLARIPAGLLIYCGRTSALLPNLGAISRFLLGHRCLLLVLDLPMSGSFPGIARPEKTPRFVKGYAPEGTIDYGGSELALFH